MRQNTGYIGLVLIFTFLLCTGTVCAKEITVGVDSGNSTITSALANASDGDTIIVTDGTYNENVVINKSVTISSENGSDVTIVQAISNNDYVFNVTANNVTINGFNISKANNAGIYLNSNSNCTISNNSLHGNIVGIYLSKSDNNILTNNNASDNECGILLHFSCSNTLTDNSMSSNIFSLVINANTIEEYTNVIDVSNLANGKPIYYLLNCSDMIVPSNAGIVYAINSTNITLKDIELSNEHNAIIFFETDNSTIENVTIFNCLCGILLDTSRNNTMIDNNVSNNECGVLLDTSSNNTLTGNNASSNYGSGICIRESSNNTLVNNTAIDVYYGIYLLESNNNTVTENILSDSYNGIYVEGSNNNTLTGNNVSDIYNSGIYLDASNNNTLIHNNATSNWNAGIYVRESNYNTLVNNTAIDDYYGIYIVDSNNNILINNNASGSNYGILLDFSTSNTLTQNTMSSNGYNFLVEGLSAEGYANNIDKSNSVDGKPVYYLLNSSNITVPSDAGVVYAINSTNITVTGAEISNESYGVMFFETNNSNVENVTFSNCDFGIILDASNYCNLTDNNASGSFFGISLYGSDNNTLVNNNASHNNLCGIYLAFSNTTTLINNDASDNYDCGIYLVSSNTTTLSNNTASDNYNYGIRLSQSSSNTLTQNTMSDNRYNFHISGSIEYLNNDIAANNSVDEKPVYYLVNCSDTIIPSDAGLAYAINSTNITVSDAKISNVSWGVWFFETQNSTIENVTVSDCRYGIILDTSDNNNLTGNTAINNTREGIYVENSDNNTLSDNVAIDNQRLDFFLLGSSISCTVNDLRVTENGAQLSFCEDVDGIVYTTIKGSSSYSSSLSGMSNVNGYVTIERECSPDDDSIDTLSTNALVSSELSTARFSFVHDYSLETYEPYTRTPSFTSGNIDVDSSAESMISTNDLAPDYNMSVTFSYDDSGMSSSGESSIDLYMFNGSTWTAVNGALLDTSNNSISANLSEFGTFALFKEASSHSSNPTGGEFNIRLPDDGGEIQEPVSSTTTTILSVNSDGAVTTDTVIKSSDSATTLTLYEGTVGTDSSGNPVTEITISKPSSMPENTPDYVLESGLYYEYGPSGTTFNKEVMISIEFDPSEYEGRDPVIYTYSKEDGWIALETTVDWKTGIATAYTTHFSLYALFGDDGEEDIQASAESSTPVEDVPVVGDTRSGYLYWILGIVVIFGLGIVVVKKQK